VSPDVVRAWAASQRVDVDLTETVPESLIDQYLRDRATRPPVPRPRERTAPVVLVVDDEADVREWLRISLSLEGWIVEEAASGEDAIEVWRRTTPDLILLDQRLPGMTGLECAAQLRDHTSDTRIFMFSAYLDAAATEEARRLQILPLSKVDHESLFQLLAVLFEDIRSSQAASV
jgi:CheY-like chemotaxis protein